MKTIKNFEGFKKSLLAATNGTMEEAFDSSVLFSGCEYYSYRVYVDAIHYYNMFVIHNIATNTYDVALETACCGTSTMSRKIKTQKSLIDSVVAWISCNYLNIKKIDSDSEEYTDMCENSETENAECASGNDVFEGCKTVKDVMEVKQELNARFGKDQYFDTDDLQPNKAIIAKIEDINYCPNQNTCCIVSPFVHCNYNYKSDSCIKAHKNFIHDCEQLNKQMKAKQNPEWHHVSLATLANIDIDMLDETRQIYMHVRYQLNTVIKAIYKCNHYTTMDILRTSIIQHIENLLRNKKVNRSLLRYAEAQIDNCYLVNGVISSKYAGSYSEKSSRAYKKYFCL